MKKFAVLAVIVGLAYGVAGSQAMSSTSGNIASAHQAREAAIEAAINGK